MNTRHEPRPPARPIGRVLPALLGALLLSAISATATLLFVRQLPLGSMLRIGNARVRSTLETTARALTAEAREGLLLAQIGGLFTDGWKRPANAAMREKQIGDVAQGCTQVGVARLVQLAARLNTSAQALVALGGAPASAPRADWSLARPYLQGLETQTFRHHQLMLRAAIARAYESLGLRPGTAVALAGTYVGHALNPFLEFITPQLERLAADAEARGDSAAAASTRRVLARLLKQWTLDAGPAGLRLLAAGLLAGHLERRAVSAAGGDADTLRAIAGDLRSWRAAWRTAAADRPAPAFQVADDISHATLQQSRLLGVFVGMIWLAVAAGVAALLSLATGWTLLRPHAVVPGGGALLRGGGIVLLVSGVLCVAWLLSFPQQSRLDLRMDVGQLRYWPRFAIASCVGTLLTIGVFAGWLRRRTPGLRLGSAVALAAAFSWLALSLFGLLGPVAHRQLAAYEAALAAAYADPIASVAGPAADAHLDRLRAWEP